MDWLNEFFYQLVSVFLFAVSLGFMFYFLSEKNQTGFLICALLSWVLFGAAGFLYLNKRVLIEPETGGVLRPANDPNPPDPPQCREVPDGAMRVFLGSSLVYTSKQSFSVIVVKGEKLLSVERSQNGLYINAKVRSRDRRIIAEIQNNKFRLNPTNYFKRERPDKHSLIVYDQEGREVLNVRYLNPLTMKLTGLFLYPNLAPIIIDDDKLTIQTNTFYQACLGEASTAIRIN